MSEAATKHTPGPWKVGYWSGQCHIPEHAGNHPGGEQCKYDPVFYAMEKSEYEEGDYWWVGIASEQPGVQIVWTEYDELKIRPADARLISAAPELLECLKEAYQEFSEEGYTPQKWQNAIEKATGIAL